jgi:hypothetical protein
MLHRRPLARLLALVLGIALLAISPLAANSALAQDQGDIYTVRDVEVDVTADNAAVARDKAINEAQRKAFGTLYSRRSFPSWTSRGWCRISTCSGSVVQPYAILQP